MHHNRLASTAALLVLPLLLSACVEICGQRLSFFHDEAADRLSILLFYDGVFDHVERGGGTPGPQQLRAFAKAGDIMLLDWPFHIQQSRIRAAAEDANASPAARALANAWLDQASTQPIGWYRDAYDRVGAAQLVVIEDVASFINRVNAAINEAALAHVAGNAENNDRWRRSHARFAEAARNGHQWIALNGNSLTISLPVHAREWAAFMADAVNESGEYFEELAPIIAMALTRTNISYRNDDQGVQIQLGDPHQPGSIVLRHALDDRPYRNNMEDTLKELMPRRLDHAIGRQLLGDEPPPESPGDRALREWGPPEIRLHALFSLVESGTPNEQAAAMQQLRALAAEWNETSSIPRAPTGADASPEPSFDDWRAWLRGLQYFPIGAPPLD